MNSGLNDILKGVAWNQVLSFIKSNFLVLFLSIPAQISACSHICESGKLFSMCGYQHVSGAEKSIP